MSRSKIAGVGVPCDEPERSVLSATSQEERGRRLLERRWDDAFIVGAVIVAVIGERL
jgi:hypothetical protein